MFRIVALGGSNTFGYPAQKIERRETYPAQLEALLRSLNLDVEITNSGMSSKRTDQMLAALDEKVPPGTTHVVFQPGNNDCAQNIPAQIRNRNIEHIELALQNRGIKVLIWGNQEMVGLPRQVGDPDHLTPVGYRQLAERLLPRVLEFLRS